MFSGGQGKKSRIPSSVEIRRESTWVIRTAQLDDLEDRYRLNSVFPFPGGGAINAYTTYLHAQYLRSSLPI